MRLREPLRLPLLVAVAYAAAAAGGLLLGVGSEGVTVAWPAAGLTLVLLLNRPYRDWPRILAAIGVVELAIDAAAGFPPLVVAGLVATNLIEPVLGATLYRRLTRSEEPPELGRPRDALRLGICAVVAPAMANVLAASAVIGAGMTDVRPTTVWLSFTTTDMLGIITAAPLFLAIAQHRARLSGEIVGMVGATVAAATVVFLLGNGLHLYVAALPMLWAAVRRGPFAASLTSIALVVTAAFLTGRGLGPFAAQTVHAILDLQAALVSLEVLVVATAVVAAALSRARDAADLQARSFERILGSLSSVVLTQRVYPDESAEVVFLGPGFDRLLGRPVTPETLRETARAAMHPDDRATVAETAAYATLAAGREITVDWRVPLPIAGHRWLRTRLIPRQAVAAGEPVLVDGLVADVTREREMLAALAEQGEVVERLTSSIAESVYTLEVLPDGELVPRFRSESFTTLTGGVATDAPNDAWTERVHPDDRHLMEGLLERDSWSIEYRLLGLDGVERWILDRARRHVTPDGRVFIEGIAADNTERRHAEQSRDEAVARLRLMSETDELTGLANRRVMTAALEAARTTAHGRGLGIGVLMLDVDRFKSVNDTYGHAAGDVVLRELADRMVAAVAGEGTVARWGGEEFCVLLREADGTRARAVGERIRHAVAAAPFPLPGDIGLDVTISVGGAVGAGTIEHLVDEADRALYSAKRGGRDQVRLFSDLGPTDLIPGDSDAVRLAQALAVAAETREGVQDLHSRQVAELAAAVAAELGLPEGMVERCRLAGWLHDVGKLTIADAIVARTDPLDPAEQATMAAHAAVGAELVASMPGVAEAHLGVRHHHERFDGRGYPDGLAGDAIPLEARIVAAADVFSIATGRRAVERPAAIAELRAASGTHLDPRVVAALLRVLDDEARARADRFDAAA
jgi:diguanylate cyclase (GGDEF)-like protein